LRLGPAIVKEVSREGAEPVLRLAENRRK
jgi:hypothetical protein